MVKYIPLDTLLAEIEKRINEIDKYYCDINCAYQRIEECKGFVSFLDTLEVKEVDLDDYYHKFLEKEWFGNNHVRTVSEMMAFTAKHFFELGLKAQKGE